MESTNAIKDLFGETLNKRGEDGKIKSVKVDDWYKDF